MAQTLRKKNTGEPTTNGGQFGSRRHGDADAGLTPPARSSNRFIEGARLALDEGATYQEVADEFNGRYAEEAGPGFLAGAFDAPTDGENLVASWGVAREVFNRLVRIREADIYEAKKNHFRQFVQQVNSKWQVAAVLGSGGGAGGDATILVGSDIVEGSAEMFAAYRFPAGWRCAALSASNLPGTVKQRALAAMRELP